MKTIILARVSSREQESGDSIPAQVRRLTDYAKHHKLDVVDVYQLVESSSKAKRVQFNEIVERIKHSPEPIILVTDTIDRLQRSFRESVILDEPIKSGKLELRFVRENLIINQDSNSSDVLRWDVGVMFAKSYIAQSVDNIKRVFAERTRNGEWSFQAPFGYINVRTSDGKSDIVIDPLRSTIVKWIFDLYASGNESLQTISEKSLTEFGNKIRTSQLNHILNNPFYYGEMLIKGKLYPHRYETLISRELYQKCIDVRKGYHVEPKRWAGLPFAYRGLIRCAECGCRITFETKKSKYIYGHCTQKKYKHSIRYVNENNLTEQLMAILGNIEIPHEEYEKVSEVMRQTQQSQTKKQQSVATALNTEITKIKTRKDKLLDLFVDGKVSENDYQAKANEYDRQATKLTDKLERLELTTDDQYATLSHLLSLSKNATGLFKEAQPEEKRAILNLIGSNFLLDGDQLRWEYKKPFNFMASCRKNATWCWE